MTFPLRRLDALCEINIGRTPSRSNGRYWGSGHTWVTISDMGRAPVVTGSKEEITQAAVTECRPRLVEPGTVLLSFKLSIGKVAIAGKPLFTNEAIAALPIRDARVLDVNYLRCALQTIDLAKDLDRAAKGKTLNRAKLAKLEIPLPPLREQRRIAALLDKADALIAKRQRAIAMLDELAQAVFLKMFGDPVTNEKEWDVVTIGDLGQVITGNTPSRSDPSNYGEAIDWIKPDKLAAPGWVVGRADEQLSDAGMSRARLVSPGAILVTCIAGSKGSIGNCKLVQSTVAFNQQINAIQPAGVNSWFVFFLIRAMKKSLEDASTDDMTRLLNKSRFSAMPAIRPPVELAEQFGGIIDRIHDGMPSQAASSAALGSLLDAARVGIFGGHCP